MKTQNVSNETKYLIQNDNNDEDDDDDYVNADTDDYPVGDNKDYTHDGGSWRKCFLTKYPTFQMKMLTKESGVGNPSHSLWG